MNNNIYYYLGARFSFHTILCSCIIYLQEFDFANNSKINFNIAYCDLFSLPPPLFFGVTSVFILHLQTGKQHKH